MEVISCRSEGSFKTNDHYCDEKKYVWRCKNETLCNLIIPLQSLELNMWDAWELLPATPKIALKHTSHQNENALRDLMKKSELENGYRETLKPLILPVSLENFKETFLYNSSSFYIVEALKIAGNKILEASDWSSVDSSTPKQLLSHAGLPVSKAKKLKIGTYVDGVIAKTIFTDINIVMIEETDTKLTWKVMSYSPD